MKVSTGRPSFRGMDVDWSISSRPKPSNPSSSDKLPYTDAALSREVERLQSAWRACQESRRRSAIYDYLNRLFDVVMAWHAEGEALVRSGRALQLYRHGLKGKIEPFAVLIACSSDGVHRRTCSKWSRLLRYAEECKRDSETLELFVKRKGGINRCASHYARRLRRQHKASARLGDYLGRRVFRR